MSISSDFLLSMRILARTENDNKPAESRTLWRCQSLVVYHGIFSKKCELMLLRRETASVQFHTQVVVVCIQYISAKIHSKCASQPTIAKKITKTPLFFDVKVVQGHRCFFTPGKVVGSACYDEQQVCV